MNNNNYQTVMNGQGRMASNANSGMPNRGSGFQPGQPITSVLNNGRGSTTEQMNQANAMILNSFGVDTMMQNPNTPMNVSQNNQAQPMQVTQPMNYDPRIIQAAKVIMEERARREAEASVPSFLQQSSNNVGSATGMDNVGNGQANNQQSLFGVNPNMPNNMQQGNSGMPNNGNMNNNQGTSGNAGNNGNSGTQKSWWEDMVDNMTGTPTNNTGAGNGQLPQNTSGNQAMQSNMGGQMNSSNVDQAQMAYRQSMVDYNARMLLAAQEHGVDTATLKQAMSSMTPEQSAMMVVNFLKANGGQQIPNAMQNNGNPNAYQPSYTDPSSLPGQGSMMSNQMPGFNANGQPLSNPNNNGVPNMPTSPQLSSPMMPSLANMNGSRDLSVTGRSSNGYPVSMAAASEI